MSKYGYALEKFGCAIYTLAVGEEEIRKRLLIIFQGDLLCVTPVHLPEKVREDYKWILEQIQKYDQKYKGQKKYYESFENGAEKYAHLLPTKIEATLHRIKRKTATKIAERIYAIWEVVEEESTKTI
ncbi:MAG: hypothetical protein FJZ98_05595 [Chloroflexi bacterium]|nr:hypothetical protein [Chloroflexota bacterium]